MKKRILAFALTLAMVVGSLSALSLMSFATVPEEDIDEVNVVSTVLELGKSDPTYPVSYDAKENIISFNDSLANTLIRTYVQGDCNVLGTYGDRTMSFTLNIESMYAYDFAANGGYATKAAKSFCGYQKNGKLSGDINDNSPTLDYDRLIFTPHATVEPDNTVAGCMFTEIVNDTTDGLVLLHIGSSGTVTPVILGKSYNTDIALEFKWGADGQLKIYVGGTLKATITDGATITVPSGKPCILSYRNAINGYSGFNYMRGKLSGSNDYTYFKATIKNYKNTVVYDNKMITDDISSIDNDTSTQVPIKMSFVQETAIYDADESAENEKNVIDVRFIASLTTLDAEVAGFEISKKGSVKDPLKKDSNTVYSSILQNVEGDIKMISASEGEYLTALTVNKVDAESTVTFIIRPYIVVDGTAQYGQAYEVTYTNGAFTSCTATN